MAKTEKQKPVNMMRSIKMPFNDAEGAQMGHQIAFISQEIEVIKEEAKAQADSFKQQITAKETQMKGLIRSMNLGFQMVQKSCEFKKNFDSGKREYWFEGNLVDEEPLTAHDHQLDLEEAEKSDMASKKDEATTTDSSTNEGPKNDEDLVPIELTEELKAQRDEFIKLGDQAMKKKKYKDGHTYYLAAQKIDASNAELAGKIERTESFLTLVNNAEELQKGGAKGTDKLPVHNENNPMHDSQTFKDVVLAVGNGDEFYKKKKFQDAEIEYLKAYNLNPEHEGLKEKLEETKLKVDRLIEANALPPREEWPK